MGNGGPDRPASFESAGAVYEFIIGLSGLADFRATANWPSVDVLHLAGMDVAIRSLLQRGEWPLSTSASGAPGTLGWLERFCAEARVRLVTLEGTGERQLSWLRRIAAGLVNRGGPPVAIDSVGFDGPAYDFYARFLRDLPMDLALGSNDVFDSLTAGPGGVDLLRPSSVETGLRELVAELRGNPELLGRVLDLMSSQELDALLDNEHGLGWFVFNEMRFGRYESGLSVLAGRLEDVRRLTGVGEVDRNGGLNRFRRRSFWRGSRPRATQRYIDAKLSSDDDILVAGRQYLLAVDIGEQDLATTALGKLALLEEIQAWEPGSDGVWAEVGVTPLGMRVVGSRVQQVWVPTSGMTQRLYFTVAPESDGVCSARICLYVNQNVVQSLKISARCVRTSGQASPSAADLARSLGLPDDALGERAWATKIEYTLHGLETPTPSRTISLVVNDNRGVAVTTIKGEDHFGVYTANGLELLVESVRKELEDTAALPPEPGKQPFYAFGSAQDGNEGAPAWFAERMQELAKKGWKLFIEVFKRDRGKLQRLLRDDNGRISVAHILLEKVIPWAAVYDREFTPDVDTDLKGNKLRVGTCEAGLPERDGTFPKEGCGTHPSCLLRDPAYRPHTVACPRHFWGFRHQIELPPQQSADGTPAANVRRQVQAGQMPLMTTGMHGGLRFANSHFADLSQAMAQSSRPANLQSPRFDRNEVIHDLNRTDQDIVYLYCHAEGGYGTAVSEPAFRVRRQRGPLDPDEPAEEPPIQVEHVAGGPWTNSPLIVLNGCRTAAFRPDALSKFIAEFVYAREAGGILATEIPIFEELATEVGIRFVRDFLDGKSAGRALLLIRRDLLRRRNPLGLAYMLYATMDFHLGGDGPGRRTLTENVVSAGGGAVAPERQLVSVW